MALPQITLYVYYQIFFQDESEYAYALTLADSNGIYRKCPRDAAATFGIPYPYPSGDLNAISKGVLFISPQTPGAAIMFPGATGMVYDDTVDTQLVPGQAGTPASVWPATSDGLFTWAGIIMHLNGQGSGGGISLLPMAQRRWAIGFESLIDNPNSNANTYLKDSSRLLDGLGFPLRSESSARAQTALTNSYITPVDKWQSWERFYIRRRNTPANLTFFWFALGGSTPSQMQLRAGITASGELGIYNYNGATNTLLGSVVPLTLNSWYKIDIILQYNSAAAGGTGRVRLWVNGGSGQFDVSIPVASGGLGANNPVTGHTSSQMGVGNQTNIGAFNTLDLDVDDWINCEPPLQPGTSLDWLTGSHVKPVWSTSLGALDSGGWAGSYGFLNSTRTAQTSIVGTAVNTTTSTANAVRHGITDAVDTTIAQDMPALEFGPAAATIISQVTDPDVALTGAQGYTAAGVLTSIAINDLTANPFRVMYAPTGMTTPDSIVPFGVYRLKSASINQVIIIGLQAYIETIGVFDKTDDPLNQTPPVNTIYHNGPYFNTVWAAQGPTFNAPVGTVGGTYVGNGTTNPIALPGPCHWLFIRNVSAVAVPVIWFSGGAGGNLTNEINITDNTPVRCYADATGNCFFVVSGADTNVNTAGQTYQYIAYCDPGLRYNIAGDFLFQNAAVAGTYNLFNASFTPFCGFIQRQRFSASVTAGLFFKGPGNSGADACTPNASAVLSNAWTHAAGQIVAGTGLNALADNKAFSMFRLDDGTGGVVVQCMTYTGNGGGSRNIALTPASGRFPLFALVIPHTAQALFRDPSHTGTNSANFASGVNNATTGITASAIDQITVGSTLNANGVVYEVFVFPGDTSGWNNGSFTTPGGASSGFPSVGAPAGGINILGNGGLDLDGTTALTALLSISGIYTLVEGKREDTLYDRLSGQPNVDVKIPDPFFKTGYVGG